MGSKAAIVTDEARIQPTKRKSPDPVSKWFGSVRGVWDEFARFLTDVRAEMRKVVAPSRKEVQTTTTVVIIAVFLFGAFFFVVDYIFGHSMAALMQRMSGLQ